MEQPPEFEIETVEREGELVVTARLSLAPDECYRLFCDADLIFDWLWVVDTAVVQRRDERNRAVQVDFIGSLQRASIGYTLSYDYDDAQREVRWHNVGRGVKQLVGSARFLPHPRSGCLLEYHLSSQLMAGLPPWADQLYRDRPAEAVVLDFCEFVERQSDRRA